MRALLVAMCAVAAACSSSNLLPQQALDMAHAAPVDMARHASDLADTTGLDGAVPDLSQLGIPPLPPIDMAEPVLLQHAILPSATNASTSNPNDPHYAYAESNGAGNGRLMIFLPGTNGIPSQYSEFMAFAASTGYHVIGLDWPNQTGAASSLCNNDLPCYLNLRIESWDGDNVSSVIDTNTDNCVHHRIVALLVYLVARYPAEGWEQFVDKTNGEPLWSKIVPAGHSQGGGMAAFIASFEKVPRVVMFSSVSDATQPPMPTPAPWIASHVTPSAAYFGLDHSDDQAYFPKISVDWPVLGMAQFGPMTDVDTEFPPYGHSHQLTGTRALTTPHNQVVSNSVPTVNGVPVYEDAWRYLIGP